MRTAVPWALGMSLLLALNAGAQRRQPRGPERAYRQALTDFARGAASSAVRQVIALEKDESTAGIRRIELRTAELLAREEPESLVAQAVLRLAVRQAHYDANEPFSEPFGFERVSMEGLKDLAALYVESSFRDDASSLAAGLLVHMAHSVSELRSVHRLAAAADLLETALAYDRAHPAALHSLAVAHELQGRYGQALPYLERLQQLEPGDPRLRMRFALVTARSGRLKSGRRLLEELTTEGPIWVRDLATQELARLLAESGQAGQAEALLRQGLVELPREKLSLQLAALLDPDWAASTEVLESWLDEAPRDAGRSGRWIYDDGAKEEIEALGLELRSAAADRLDLLERALSRLPGRSGNPTEGADR